MAGKRRKIELVMGGIKKDGLVCVTGEFFIRRKLADHIKEMMIKDEIDKFESLWGTDSKITACRFYGWYLWCPHCKRVEIVAESDMPFDVKDGKEHKWKCNYCLKEFELVKE